MHEACVFRKSVRAKVVHIRLLPLVQEEGHRLHITEQIPIVALGVFRLEGNLVVHIK